jgi:type IV pilus assembly protein PilW
MVVYGNGGSPSEGDSVTGSASVYAVQTPSAFVPNDYVIVALGAAPLAACAGVILDKVTVTDVTGSSITVQTGGANANNNARIYNLGSDPKVLVYAIRNGNLTVCEYLKYDCGADANKNDATVWVPMVSNIVSLRAQYGRDTSTPMDGVDTFNQTAPTNNCEWLRVSAVRLALVARSAQPDCPPVRNADGTCQAVTANAPTWAGSADNAIDLSGMSTPTGFDWHNFRYRVFETTVPIRNIMLMGAQTGC